MYQQRVIHEQAELDIKIAALDSFITSSEVFEALHENDKQLMYTQLRIMRDYSFVLAKRILRF